MVTVGEFLAQLVSLASQVPSFVFTADFLWAAGIVLSMGIVLKLILKFAT